ncbi:MAG: hypothetical protein KAG28_00850 [Cocleimonas sp.]|nr:hypothetical protein [Cocleimonas sp.]
MTPVVYNAKGNIIELAEKIGSGGEGNVYKLQADKTRVAKLYHDEIPLEKQQKIKSMINSANKALNKVTAWPLATLHPTKNGIICGFIMPNITDGEPLHHIYSPSHRKQLFPAIDWAFLVNICRNIVAAFATVHAKGHRIGDVNPNLVFISKQTRACLIDCDSFQIKFSGKIYPCEVGVPHFTPPELQNASSFKGITRTINHDNFGLSLLLFHTLMMGRHPFSGVYTANTDLSLEQLIQQHLYAFSDKLEKKNKISPPPNAITPDILSNELKRLFEKSFSKFSSRFNRPTTREWLSALDAFKKSLTSCEQCKHHKYYNRLPHCPWCKAEQQGIFYFPTPINDIISTDFSFNLSTVWKEITAIVTPEDQQLNIKERLQYLSNTVTAQKIPDSLIKKKNNVIYKKITALWISLLIVIFLSEWIIISLIPLAYLFFYDINVKKEQALRQQVLNDAEKSLKRLTIRWNKEASVELFKHKRKQLTEFYNKHHQFDSYSQSLLKQLEGNKQKLQLKAYLKQFYISNARIKGISLARKTALSSFGIETAVDIKSKAVSQVPSFGTTYTKALLDWRKGIERQFVFNPNKAIDPADIATVKIKTVTLKRDLESKLCAGADQLQQINQQIIRSRKQLIPLINISLKQVAQAKADLDYLTHYR